MTSAISDYALVKELGFEANTKYADVGYRRGVLVSVLILLNLLVKSLWRASEAADHFCSGDSGPDLAFYMFKNEREAIEAHIAKVGATWKVISLDLKNLQGLDFQRVFAGSLLLLPRFLFLLTRHYGLGALRTFVHPFFGYLIYRHLLEKLRHLHPSRAIVTANISHPVSLGIHYAARGAGLTTIYIEHAMTPRLIAKDRGYDRYLVRSPHTRLLLADSGVELDRIHVLPYWQFAAEELLPSARKSINLVGIAVNDLDTFDSVVELATYLKKIGMMCLIRIHDADRRLAKFKQFGAAADLEVSSAASGPISEFLCRCDVVFAGNSSVLLDCYRAKVPVIYYWSGDSILFDYYGIVQHTRCPSARNTAQLDVLLGR